jgi:hypothetical protein
VHHSSAHTAYPIREETISSGILDCSHDSWTCLVLIENGVAHPGHEHHRDQEGDEGIVRHLAGKFSELRLKCKRDKKETIESL